MLFTSSRCKLLLGDRFASRPELRRGNEVIERVDHFTYLGSLNISNGFMSNELSARFQKARLTLSTYVIHGKDEIFVYQLRVRGKRYSWGTSMIASSGITR